MMLHEKEGGKVQKALALMPSQTKGAGTHSAVAAARCEAFNGVSSSREAQSSDDHASDGLVAEVDALQDLHM